MNRSLIACSILVATGLAGCVSGPLLRLSDNDVGAVLQPIAKSNVIDARAEFRRIFCQVNDDHGADLPDYRDCNESLHLLADEAPASGQLQAKLEFRHVLRVVILPGILGECLIDQVSPFYYGIEHLHRYGNVTAVVLKDIRGRASSEHNSRVINSYLEGLVKGDGEKLILIGYSKGMTDLLYFLGDRELSAVTARKIDAVVSVAGVVNGTPIADDVSPIVKMLARVFPYGECPTQDASGIEDLTREIQFPRLSKLDLPGHIQYFSLPAYAAAADISQLLRSFYKRLSLVDPHNDGQVIYYDSIIPGSHLLGYANADHWAVALPFSRHIDRLRLTNRIIARGADKNAFPREVLLESILRYVDSKL